jgi:hypothetical protein
MAQTGFTPISLYYSTTVSAAPTAGNLANGELAINITDGRLFYKDNLGAVQVLATKGAGSIGGSNTQVQFNNNGALGGSANLTWNGTILTSTGFSGPLNGTVGATTPSTGSFTTLAASSTVSGTGFTNYFASPPPIGGTAANTGAFTTLTASADSSFTSTGALLISKGTTGQQPGSPATGMMRYNTTTNQFEGYSGSSPAWKSIGGSALSNDTSTASNLFPVFAGATSGTAENLYTSNAKLLYKPSTGELSASVPRADNGIFVNKATIATSYTIASGDNGMSAGTITVANGVTVTVSDGSFWTVV